MRQKCEFFPFQHNYIHCTINHQRCKFDSNIHPQKCQRCTKRGIPCNFKLSAQGRRNDIKLHLPPIQVSSHEAIEPVNEMNNVDSVSGFSNSGGRLAITNKSVHYHHQSGLCQMRDIAATVVLSRLIPRRKNLPFSFHPGFIFFPSPPSHPPVEHKPPLLFIWGNPAPKKYVIVVIGMQRGSTRSRTKY
jgi:hypothetical protein